MWWKYFILVTNMSGPICIKFAQWASTRKDIFSQEFCDHFAYLQRRTRAHSWKFTKFRLEQAFGKKWRDIFVKFDNDRKPVGSGCVGQVYKAYIRPENILDDQLLNELLEESNQDEDTSFNFFEGAEVIGFGHLFGTKDKELDEAEVNRRKIRIDRETDQIKLEHELEKLEDRDVTDTEDFENYSKSHIEEKLHKIDETTDDLDGLVPVAVKVLHPRIHSKFKQDIVIIKYFANLLEFFFPSLKWLDLKNCIDIFEETMKNQLDLKHEAKCMEYFKDNFQNIANVRFASPIRPYVTKNVLVETYEEAEPLCHFMKENTDDGSDYSCSELKSHIAKIGLNVLLKMIFEDNLVHGDLHPGNIMVQNYEAYTGPDSHHNDNLVMLDMCDVLIVKPKVEEFERIRLLILDCGITAHLQLEDHDKLLSLFTAVVKGNGEQAADLFLKNSKEHHCKDTDDFKRDMDQIIKKSHHDKLTLESTDVGELLSQVFSLLNKHQIKLESNFASIILAVFVIEGVGRTLDPNIDLMEMAKPYLIR